MAKLISSAEIPDFKQVKSEEKYVKESKVSITPAEKRLVEQPILSSVQMKVSSHIADDKILVKPMERSKDSVVKVLFRKKLQW